MSESAPEAVIRPADPHDPRVAALVARGYLPLAGAHLEEMEPTAPPESRHALTVDQFRSAGVRLWVAELGDALVGSVALKDLGGGHVELKTMRASRSVRGTGLGRRLLLHALDEARSAGATRVSLETGSGDVFAPARSLYLAHGFAPCEPFGDYRPDRHSTFLTLPL